MPPTTSDYSSELTPSNLTGQTLVEHNTDEDLMQNGLAVMLKVISIDVEDFEFHVLPGLPQYLFDPTSMSTGLEAHLKIPNDRGLTRAPFCIASPLVHTGFSVKWTDIIHLLAARTAT